MPQLIQYVQAALSPGIKGLEREADYPPPSNADVKTEWSYTSTTPQVFTAWFIIKYI
jgi:hypothetical protein